MIAMMWVLRLDPFRTTGLHRLAFMINDTCGSGSDIRMKVSPRGGLSVSPSCRVVVEETRPRRDLRPPGTRLWSWSGRRGRLTGEQAAVAQVARAVSGMSFRCITAHSMQVTTHPMCFCDTFRMHTDKSTPLGDCCCYCY